MRLRILALLFACVAAVGSLSGCKAVEDVVAPPIEVVEEPTVAATGASVDGSLPKGFPEELPLWPEASVKSGEVADGSIMLSLRTADAYDDVVAGTAAGFEEAGFSVAKSAGDKKATMLDVIGSDWEGVVTISTADKGVTIDYLLAEPTQ